MISAHERKTIMLQPRILVDSCERNFFIKNRKKLFMCGSIGCELCRNFREQDISQKTRSNMYCANNKTNKNNDEHQEENLSQMSVLKHNKSNVSIRFTSFHHHIASYILLAIILCSGTLCMAQISGKLLAFLLLFVVGKLMKKRKSI